MSWISWIHSELKRGENTFEWVLDELSILKLEWFESECNKKRNMAGTSIWKMSTIFPMGFFLGGQSPYGHATRCLTTHMNSHSLFVMINFLNGTLGNNNCLSWQVVCYTARGWIMVLSQHVERYWLLHLDAITPAVTSSPLTSLSNSMSKMRVSKTGRGACGRQARSQFQSSGQHSRVKCLS